MIVYQRVTVLNTKNNWSAFLHLYCERCSFIWFLISLLYLYRSCLDAVSALPVFSVIELKLEITLLPGCIRAPAARTFVCRHVSVATLFGGSCLCCHPTDQLTNYLINVHKPAYISLNKSQTALVAFRQCGSIDSYLQTVWQKGTKAAASKQWETRAVAFMLHCNKGRCLYISSSFFWYRWLYELSNKVSDSVEGITVTVCGRLRSGWIKFSSTVRNVCQTRKLKLAIQHYQRTGCVGGCRK